jgi:hypothetical protein
MVLRPVGDERQGLTVSHGGRLGLQTVVALQYVMDW